MKIGIFSDIHDNIANLQLAINYLVERNIEVSIFCGDFCSPIPSRLMGKYPGTIHCVFGNGDGDRFAILNIANKESNNLIIHGEYGEIIVENKRLCITHYPFYARGLAHTGDYDAVFFGHSHIRNKEIINNCLLLNPGEIMGFKGNPSIALYDTLINDSEFIDL